MTFLDIVIGYFTIIGILLGIAIVLIFTVILIDKSERPND